jgi:hypothetical protein
MINKVQGQPKGHGGILPQPPSIRLMYWNFSDVGEYGMKMVGMELAIEN